MSVDIIWDPKVLRRTITKCDRILETDDALLAAMARRKAEKTRRIALIRLSKILPVLEARKGKHGRRT